MLSSEGETEVEIETDAVQLLGKESIWGRSIVLEGPGKSKSLSRRINQLQVDTAGCSLGFVDIRTKVMF